MPCLGSILGNSQCALGCPPLSASIGVCGSTSRPCRGHLQCETNQPGVSRKGKFSRKISGTTTAQAGQVAGHSDWSSVVSCSMLRGTGGQPGHGLPVVGSGLSKVIEVGCRPPVSRSRVNKDRNVFKFLASRAQVPVPDNVKGCT